MPSILLIQPENRDINRFRRFQFNNFSQVTMPYLAAFAVEKGYKATVIDEYRQKVPYQKKFDLAAITVNTPNAPHCYEMARRFRELGVKVAMGGPHATLVPEEAGKECDYVFTGEAELTWPRFLDDFKEGKAQKIYLAEPLQSLAGLPMPRWDLLKRSSLMKGAIVATRGCPHNCSYCCLKQIYQGGFRARPAFEVAKEAKALKTKFFVFWDDNFFADKAYALELMKLIAPLKRRWAAQATIRDCEDEELLAAAKAAGCAYLFLGLESFSQSSLEDAAKQVNRVDGYERIVKLIHAHGIMIQAGIVFGFDSDTLDVFDMTLSACEKLGIDGVTVSVLTPFPKTPIHKQLEAQGRLLGLGWSSMSGKTSVSFIPAQMTPEELFAGYNRFRRRFYSASSFVKRMRVSRTSVWMNFVMNLGYRLAIRPEDRG
ncbi:MAG: B12-binding domain-containing radical SAM protein [Clostridiales bacterium]|jgi:radical SAM superfamily enzyme YgiQ (UPF0313 family)|nr:B12-binding domain-containing radical SAM protein [Clostridiales bacterium]